MATQIMERNHAVLLPRPDALPQKDEYRAEESNAGAFRGLAFAMLFNLVLALAAAAAWELWRILR